MLKKIFIAIAFALAALAAFIATRPAEFRIVRSAEIKAPAEVVFPLVDNLNTWSQWSPWEKVDPEMKRTYSGSYSGVGAAYEWEGNENVGSGRMKIVESEAPRRIGIDLEFITPFPATNQVSFVFEPVAEGTRVTWAMEGKNGFLGRAFDLIMDFDSMIGGQYEKGLAALKQLAENKATSA